MKRFVRPAVIIPILIGAAGAIALFMLGDAADAPGVSVIGLAAGFLLIMWGVYNAGVIKKGFLAPIILFCYGAGGIIISVAMLFDGEFEESPGIALIGVALGVLLIIIGAIKLKKARAQKG